MRKELIKTCLSLIPDGIARALVSDFTPIFLLHRIIDENGELVDSQVSQLREYLEYLRKNDYQAILLEDLFNIMIEDGSLPERTVVFTVDDGHADQFEYLAPIFGEYDIPLTFFIITDFIDGELWLWDDQVAYVLSRTKLDSITIDFPDGDSLILNLSSENKPQLVKDVRERLKNGDQNGLYEWLPSLYAAAEIEIPDGVPPYYRAASWRQVKEVVKHGHAVAPHSRTHRVLSRLDDDEARDEILGSYHYLKSKVPECADVFAYPTGRTDDFGAREMKAVRKSEMLGAVSAVPDSMRLGYNIEAVPRYPLPNNMGDFLQYMSFIEVFKNQIRKNTLIP